LQKKEFIMSTKGLRILSLFVLLSAVPLLSGCCCPTAKSEPVRVVAHDPCGPTQVAQSPAPAPALPAARDGECYAWVFIPPKTRTTTERVCTREASETLETVPAEYAWVEDKVLVKEASTRLEIVPAEYASREQRIEVQPCHTDWHQAKGARCVSETKEEQDNVFCLVKTPPVFKTVSTEYAAKPACVREINIPAEYSTVRRQVVKAPAQTRRIPIPAEFQTVERITVCESGRMAWQRVVCDSQLAPGKVSEIKAALDVAGYVTTTDDTMHKTDWVALKDFQRKNRLGMGHLTYETLNRLGIAVQ